MKVRWNITMKSLSADLMLKFRLVGHIYTLLIIDQRHSVKSFFRINAIYENLFYLSRLSIIINVKFM